jgi:DUF177 domain-containing protein
MKLRVEEITAEVKEISFPESEEEINHTLERGPIREYRVDGPILVNLSYYRAGTDVFFKGDLSALVRSTCARCAEDFEAPARRPFRFVMVAEALGEAVEEATRAEGPELSLYQGDEIDLAPLIREQMLLALPTQPLCREDCRGLCPLCGANLNNRQCDCRIESLDPRLAIFRSLRLRQS